MTSLAYWREPTVYIGQSRPHQVSADVWHVVGNPPIYWAELRRQDRLWRIVWHTGALEVGETYPTHLEALREATRVIGHTVGRDFRERFDGEQRTMIGQQKCPYSYGADVYCGRSIEVGTVWCHKHPWGKVLT